MRSTIAAAVVLTAFSAPGAASAQVTDAGAEALRASIATGVEDILQHWLPHLVASGPITVEPAGDHYRVTVPPLGGVGRDGNVIGFEAAVTATPEGWFAVAPAFGAFPERPDTEAMTAMGLSGSATYAPPYRSIMAADLLLSGVASPATSPDRIHMDGIALDVTSAPRGGDRYDYTASVTMRGFEAENPGGDRGAIGSIGASVSADDVNLAAYAGLLAAMDAAADPEATPADRLSLLGILVADRPVFFDGLRVGMSMDEVNIAIPGTNVGYGHFALALSIDGIRSGTGTLAFGMDWRDYVPTDLPAAVTAFLPTHGTVDLSLHGVPNAVLTTALGRFEAASRTMAFRPAMGIALRELAPALLTTVGLALEGVMKGEAPMGTLAAEASLHAAPGSPYHVAGTVTIVLRGLDEAIAAVGGDRRMQSAAGPLTMLKLLGREITDDAGHAARTYVLVLGPEGEATLNGTDLTAVLRTL